MTFPGVMKGGGSFRPVTPVFKKQNSILIFEAFFYMLSVHNRISAFKRYFVGDDHQSSVTTRPCCLSEDNCSRKHSWTIEGLALIIFVYKCIVLIKLR